MSRWVDLNNEEFWQVLFDEACVEGKQAERIENELDKISVDEKEIRAKAIDEFAEALKEKVSSHFRYRGIIKEPTEYEDYIDEIAEQLKGGAE